MLGLTPAETPFVKLCAMKPSRTNIFIVVLSAGARDHEPKSNAGNVEISTCMSSPRQGTKTCGQRWGKSKSVFASAFPRDATEKNPGMYTRYVQEESSQRGAQTEMVRYTSYGSVIPDFHLHQRRGMAVWILRERTKAVSLVSDIHSLMLLIPKRLSLTAARITEC